ncbi:Nif11-like leader peptide family natural product precursor [Chlorobium phaeovibrioides]|uniref:Nif11-like leader peptide family natural product precursor n=1 Tax=Chlorobium phaeovibrioides TaxID=1094 RepID=UPI001CE4581C|nr:Nif11-like leader peptide family natural product precursor [Chlorobium phaeovibrioides]
MSVEQAKAFIEKMKTDEAFREKIMTIETPEDRLKAIAAAGFECTGEEINEAGGERGEAFGVAGGGLEWCPRKKYAPW